MMGGTSGASVALEPLCVSALGAAFFGYSLNRVEAGGYVCASVGAASLAGAYSCEGRARAGARAGVTLYGYSGPFATEPVATWLNRSW